MLSASNEGNYEWAISELNFNFYVDLGSEEKAIKRVISNYTQVSGNME